MHSKHKDKIRQFVKDPAMYEAVITAIRDTFLGKRDLKDVHLLAAKSLALEMLVDAEKELHRYLAEETKAEPESKQVGL